MRNPDCPNYSICLANAAIKKKDLICPENCNGESDPAFRIHKHTTREKPIIIPVKKEDIIMEEAKPIKNCEIKDCLGMVVAQGLCRPHYDQWRFGKIQHPRLGDYKRSRPGRPRKDKAPKPKPATVKKEKVIVVDPKDALFELLRKRLKDARALADVLDLMGHKDLVKKDIDTYLRNY